MFKKMDQAEPGWDKKKLNPKETSEEVLKIAAPPAGAPMKDTSMDFLMRRPLEGENPNQQGGDVILDKDGRILKVFHMNSVNDRVSMEDLGL